MGVFKLALVGAVLAAGAVLFQQAQPHDEAALLVSFSTPPPWPIFIGVNVLAGVFRAVADALTPPPIKMLELGEGFLVTGTIYAASNAGIPDLLATNGPLSASEIATAIGAGSVDRVQRLMSACVAFGVFKRSGSESPPKYVNSALSATLRPAHPNSMKGIMHHWVEDAMGSVPFIASAYEAKDVLPWDAWQKARRTEQWVYSKGGFWKYTEDQKEQGYQFSVAMQNVDSLGANAMVADYPFDDESVHRVVDVGGASGAFLAKIVRSNPRLEGVLFDQPAVINGATAQAFWKPDGDNKDIVDRVSVVAGSFFDTDAVPVARDEHDLFMLRYILHDWQEHDVLKILKSVRAAIGDTGAKLLIGECDYPEPTETHPARSVYTIDMLMTTFFLAKERSPSDWASVLREAGFEYQKEYKTRSLLHFVEATPI